MLNALAAVNAALRPIAAVAVPAATSVGSIAVLDAGGSVASCGRSIATYSWTASGGATIQPGTAAKAPSQRGTDGSGGIADLGPSPTRQAVPIRRRSPWARTGPSFPLPRPRRTQEPVPALARSRRRSLPRPPGVALSFLPASVAQNVRSTLTITLDNSNGFDLTQAHLVVALPTNLVIPASTPGVAGVASTCAGGGEPLTATASMVTLNGAIVPANGSCTLTLSVQSATPVPIPTPWQRLR